MYSPLISTRSVLLRAVALSGRPSVGPRKFCPPVLALSAASSATASFPLSTSCVPSGRRLAGNPVSCNGPSCAKGSRRRHSQRDDGPSLGYNMSGTAPPFPSVAFLMFAYPDTTGVAAGGSAGPCPLVLPLRLWLQYPPLDGRPPEPRGLC